MKYFLHKQSFDSFHGLVCGLNSSYSAIPNTLCSSITGTVSNVREFSFPFPFTIFLSDCNLIMVERDEDSRNGKRSNGTDRKQQSPPTFVNHFAKYMESKVSYAEALRLGRTNLEILRLNTALGGSGTVTAVPFQSDGNLSRSNSTPSFDSSAPSTPSLPHSISSPDLESQDSQTENNNSSSSVHDFPNSSFSSATTEPSSNPSASINPLYFGKIKSCLSLPKSFPYQFSSSCTDLKTTSNGKLTPPPPPPPPPSRPSNSRIVREELQLLIKRAMVSGNLQRQCANCGNFQHCCGQTILEAVSSIPPTQ